jgi:hypothetical protein
MDELSVQIATIAGVVITLALAYVPGLKAWWEERDSTQKRVVLAALYLAVSAGLYVPSCLGGPQLVQCSTESIWTVVLAFLMALISSQSMYTVLPAETKERMASADS